MEDNSNIRPGDVEWIIARKEIARKYRASGMSAEDFAATQKISRAKLFRILAAEKKGNAALADGRRLNKGRVLKINNELSGWLLAFYGDHPQAGAAAIHRALEIKAEEKGWTPVPSYWWVLRFINRIAHDVKVALQQGSRERVETAAVTVRREEPRTNALWQIDASEAPVWVFHPTGTTSKIDDSANYVKPWVISIIDCATRVQMALRSFIKTPTTADALHTLRWAIAASRDPRKFAYGKPLGINSDNHKIFHPNGDWGLSLLQAGIEPQQGPIEAPHANGKVERLFLTMEHRIWTSLSSYANQYEGLAKAKESCIPWILFQRYIDQASYQNYNLVDHSELQKTPYEAWHAALQDAAGLIYDVPAVEKALRVTREYMVATDGIEVAPLRRYTGTIFEGMIGDKVMVRIPPPPEPLPDKLPVFKDGLPLGEITCTIDDSIAQELRDTRLSRTIAIDRLRNILIEQGRKDPLPGDPSLDPALVASTLANLPPEQPSTGGPFVPGPLPVVDLPPPKTQVVGKSEAIGAIPELKTGDS